MAAPETIDEAIEQVALGPKAVSVAGQSVTTQSIPELLQARDAIASQTAATKPQFGLRFSKLIPPAGG